MRVNQVLLKKIDLRERVNLQTNQKVISLTHHALPPPKKLKQPTLQASTCTTPQRYSTYSTRSALHQRKVKHRYKCEGEMQMVNTYCTQQDKTYNNNYKRFPKRSFLRSCYVVQNSNIVINVFSKKIELQQRKNDFLARTLSLQLKKNQERLSTYHKTITIQQKMWDIDGKNIERVSKKLRQSQRAKSAQDVIKLRETKIQRYTPWQVQIPDYQQQIPQGVAQRV